MNVLVTGGTGFIGSHLVDLLLENQFRVRLFSRDAELPERLKGKDITVYHGDLRDTKTVLGAMEGVDLFYHIGEMKNTSRAAAARNTLLVERIVEQLDQTGIKRFIFVSSISVSGIPSAIPATEDSPPKIVLRDHYTNYKRDAEEVIRKRSGTVEYAILRLPPVYGPGSRSLGRMISLFRTAAPIGIPFIGNGRTCLPLVHVTDAARALYLAGIQGNAAGQIFTITDGARHTWFDLFSALAKALRVRLRIIPVPPFLLRIPAVLTDLFASVFGLGPDLKNYVTFFSSDVLFDIGKTRDHLGWEPEYTDLGHAMEELVEQYEQKD